MGNYQKNKGRDDKVQHVRLYHWMLKCPAWQSLSCKGIALYVEFKKRYNGSNNGYVHMSVREAKEALNFGSKSTANKALNELLDKGFIKCRFKGKFDHKVHQASEFILTEYEFNGQKATKDFMKWKLEK